MNTLAWHIREPLGLDWPDELLSLELPETPATIDAAGTTSLMNSEGKALPVQLSADGRALVTFCSLRKHTTETLTATAEPAAGPRVDVTIENHSIRFANSQCQVRFAAAALVEDEEEDRWRVTGPILSLTGPDGQRRAGSEIRLPRSRFFPHDRRSFARVDPERAAREEAAPTVTIAITARGPVFASYEYRLTTGDGRLYTFKATLFAAWPLLRIEETCDLDRDGELRLLLGRNFPCDQYVHGEGSPNAPQRILPLPHQAAALGRLTPHHTQSHTAYPWMGFHRSDKPQGNYHGICDADLEAHADALVIMGHRPWNWTYPADSAPHLATDAGGNPLLTAGLRRGNRAWNLFILSRQQAVNSPQIDDKRFAPSPMAAWHRRLNDLPLDWVRRLDLTSDIPTDDAPPALLSAAEWQPEARHQLTQRVERLLANVATTQPPTRDEDIWHLRGLLQADPEALKALAHHALAVAEMKFSFVVGSGFLADDLSAVANRSLGPLALHYETLVRAKALSATEQARLRAILLLFAHATMEDALFPSHLNYRRPQDPHSIRNWAIEERYSDLFGTPNFQTDVYFNLGIFGAVFRGHPQARTWLEEAARQMDAQLDFHFHPGGVYEESFGYFAHMFHNLLILASILKRQGIRDFYTDQRFQDAMECLVDCLGAPRRPTLEQRLSRGEPAPRRRFWPSIGDTGYNNLEAGLTSAAAHAAWEVREHNPALADKLLHAWNEAGRPLWGGYLPKLEILYIRDLTPATPAAVPPLQTRTFHNVGHHLRADVGLPSETSIFLRSGKATHHWGFDHGHFTMTTRGSLLMPDFGYYGKEVEGGRTVHGFDTWIHNAVTFGAANSGYMGPEQRLAERCVRLEQDLSYVVVDLTMSQVKDSGWRQTRDIIPIRYFRHFLFAHNRYVFVWDRIDFSIYPSQLRIHALAESLQMQEHGIRFKGLDDVDLQVHLVLPQGAERHEGLVGRQRYVMCTQDCQQDYLWIAQPLGPDEQPYQVTSAHQADPVRPSEGTVIRIAGTDLHGQAFEDHLLCVKGDFPRDLSLDQRRFHLRGNFALVRRDHTGERVRLLDGQSINVC